MLVTTITFFLRTPVSLRVGLALAVAFGCSTPATRAPTLPDLERVLVERVNRVRSEHGVTPLEVKSALVDLARGHSFDMANGRRAFGHDGFEARADRMAELFGSQGFAENVAYRGETQGDVAGGIVTQWLESPIHKKNMLGPYEFTGLGVARTADGTVFATQLFASAR